MTPPQPTGATLRSLQKGAVRTRLDSSPRRNKDQGFGWGRECADPSCSTQLNHFHEGDYCYCCEERRDREGLAAA